MSPLRFLLLLFAPLLALPAAATPTFYPIPELPLKTAPGQHLERYIDNRRTRSLEEVVEAPFESVPDFISRRYSGDVEWFRFGLEETQTGKERLLEFGSPYINTIDVYLLREGEAPSQARHLRFGDHVPVSERPTQTRSYTLPLDLEKGERMVVYVRAESNSAMTVHATLWNRGEHALHGARVSLLHGVYFGLLGGLCLLFMPLSLLFRRREFMAFSVLALALLLLNMGTYGYVRVLAPEAGSWLPDVVTGLGALGLVIGSGLVFITLLNLRKSAPLLFWIVAATVSVALAGMPFVTTDLYRHFAQNVLSFNSILVFPLTMLAIYKAWRLREAAMIIYATGFVITVTGGTIVIMAITGVIPSSEWTLAAYQISTLIQMILLALGLGIEWRASLRERSLFKERAILAESRSELLHNLTRFLSHELITPLAAAKRAVEMVERQREGINEANRERLQRARERLSEIAAMSQLFLGREARDAFATDDMFGVREVLDRSLAMVGEQQHHCRVDCRVDDKTSLRGSCSLLAHALRNLIDNAVRHSGSEECQITITKEKDKVRLEIVDHGRGLGPRELDEFNSGRTGDGGKISGLLLVRFFMELQGGELRLRNGEQSGLIATLMMPMYRVSKET